VAVEPPPRLLREPHSLFDKTCRSPKRKRGQGTPRLRFGLRLLPSLRLFSDVEFELPALLTVAAETPQFQSSYLRHLAVQMYRHHLPFLARPFQRRRQRT